MCCVATVTFPTCLFSGNTCSTRGTTQPTSSEIRSIQCRYKSHSHAVIGACRSMTQSTLNYTSNNCEWLCSVHYSFRPSQLTGCIITHKGHERLQKTQITAFRITAELGNTRILQMSSVRGRKRKNYLAVGWKFLDPFEKLRKAAISFVMSVCPSVRMEQLGS